MRHTLRRGAHALEFALLMPVFLAIWMGIVEYCWLAFQYTSLNEAVAVGCRFGSLIDPGPGEIEAKAVVDSTKEEIEKEYASSGAQCSGKCAPTVILVNSRPARSLACSMTAPYASVTGFVPAPKTLSADAVVRLEYQRGGT